MDMLINYFVNKWLVSYIMIMMFYMNDHYITLVMLMDMLVLLDIRLNFEHRSHHYNGILLLHIMLMNHLVITQLMCCLVMGMLLLLNRYYPMRIMLNQQDK